MDKKPWHVEHDGDSYIVVTANDNILADLANKEDAELVASAPELRAEVKRLTGQVREARRLLPLITERASYKLETFPGKQFCNCCAVDEWHEGHEIWCLKRTVSAWLAANPEPRQPEPGQGDKGGEGKS